MQGQRAAHAGTDAARFRARNAQALLAAFPSQQPVHLEFADGLTNRRAVDAELAREIGLGGQGIAGAQGSLDDALFDLVGDLPVGRVVIERHE